VPTDLGDEREKATRIRHSTGGRETIVPMTNRAENTSQVGLRSGVVFTPRNSVMFEKWGSLESGMRAAGYRAHSQFDKEFRARKKGEDPFLNLL